MTLTRRRFLTISAAAAAVPGAAHAEHWQGWAFGAQVSMTLRGPADVVSAALIEARKVVIETEKLFSLYDPASMLVQLNAKGQLLHPDAQFTALMQAADHAFRHTEGLFDPTVQPLWRALAEDRDPAPALARIGWQHVRFNPSQITLGPEQALTFNGIAQGFATDRVSDVLHAHGLQNVLVNIGEHRALGGPWTLALQDPIYGVLGQRSLTQGAMATSSPSATPLGQNGHILHTHLRPQWSTVTVEAATATLADSLSTAMVLASRDQIAAITERTDVSRVTLVDFDGNLTTL